LAGRSSRRFGKRSAEDVPNNVYRRPRKYSNYERHLKKESLAKYNKRKTSSKTYEDQVRKLNSRIEASRKRLSLLRSKKKSLAYMYRGSTVPEVHIVVEYYLH
jgi:flavin-dependent dehydrogenase